LSKFKIGGFALDGARNIGSRITIKEVIGDVTTWIRLSVPSFRTSLENKHGFSKKVSTG
jgi:hypothetical protein